MNSHLSFYIDGLAWIRSKPLEPSCASHVIVLWFLTQFLVIDSQLEGGLLGVCELEPDKHILDLLLAELRAKR